MTEYTLTEEQQKVFDRVTTSKGQEFLVLRGYAGTGKTLTASTIINSGKFKSPLVLAPTAVALNALKRKFAGQVPETTVFATLAYMTTIPRSTLVVGSYKKGGFTVNLDVSASSAGDPDKDNFQKFVTWCEKVHRLDVTPYVEEDLDPETGRLSRDVDTEALSKLLRSTPLEIKPVFDTMPVEDIVKKFNNFDLVVIDEYSMVGQAKHEVIRSVAYDSKAVFLACGDAGQLQPINENINDAISDEPDQFEVFELTVPLRSDDAIANLAGRIRKGASLSSMSTSPNKSVLSVGNSITETFEKHREMFVGSDVVLTFKNANVDLLNKLVRAGKGFSGTINVGEPVMVSKNLYKGPGEIDWARGEILTAASIVDYTDYLHEVQEKAERITAHWENEANGLTDDKEVRKLRHKIDRTHHGMAVLEMLLEDHTLFLVRLSDGFDEKGRMALIRADMVDEYSLTWRNNISAVNAVAWLWADQRDDTPPVKLVSIVPAYAMTVHKAQGSELNRVVYLVSSGELWFQAKSDPDGENWHPPYTAVTRAKEKVFVLYCGNGSLE